jgi:hypothetical protein
MSTVTPVTPVTPVTQNCNIKKNGEEYFSQIYSNEKGKRAGYGFIILSLCSSVICLCLSMSATAGFGYKYYKDANNKITAGVAIIIIIGICSLSSVFSDFIQMFRIKQDAAIPVSEDQNDGIRPCFSVSQNKMIN